TRQEIFMYDRKKIIYDLSMLCALESCPKVSADGTSYPAALLNEFTEYVQMFSVMHPSAFDEVLSLLKSL
ncbi:MAG: hypothetical protein ACI4PV_02880, partial [Butyricicoccus sp.]